MDESSLSGECRRVYLVRGSAVHENPGEEVPFAGIWKVLNEVNREHLPGVVTGLPRLHGVAIGAGIAGHGDHKVPDVVIAAEEIGVGDFVSDALVFGGKGGI